MERLFIRFKHKLFTYTRPYILKILSRKIEDFNVNFKPFVRGAPKEREQARTPGSRGSGASDETSDERSSFLLLVKILNIYLHH